MIDARNLHDVIDVIDQLRDRQRRQRIRRFEFVALFGASLRIVFVFLVNRILLRFESLVAFGTLRRNCLRVNKHAVEVYLDHAAILRDPASTDRRECFAGRC